MNNKTAFTPEALKKIDAYECHDLHNACIFNKGMNDMDPQGEMENHLILKREDWISCKLKETPTSEPKAEKVRVTLKTMGENTFPIRQMGLFLKTQNPTIEADALWRRKELTADKVRALPKAFQIEMTHRFNAFYPECDGEVIPMRLVRIHEWTEGLEATLFCSGVDGDKRNYAFYDTRYALNKGRYQIGKVYGFMLSALMYQVETRKQDWGESWLRHSKWAAMMVNLPPHAGYGENAHVCSDVSAVEAQFTRHGVDFYKLQLEVTPAPVYVKKELVDDIDPIRRLQTVEIEENGETQKAFLFRLTNPAVIKALSDARQTLPTHDAPTEEKPTRPKIKVISNEAFPQEFPTNITGTLWFQGRLAYTTLPRNH